MIGGSGLYSMEGLRDVVEARPQTPFGLPSDAIVVGTLGASRVAFLPRHGRGHRLTPGEVPYRANLYALKLLGVGRVVAVSACGSMREEIAPRDVVVPDQLVDRTRGRAATFFGDGVVAHIGFADPFCPILSARLAAEAEREFAAGPGGLRAPDSVPPTAAGQAGRAVHRGGAYVAIEGPQFSTRAESAIYRSWGVSVIGMTALPEARLAREAELCYGMLAFATDYDVWHAEAEPVTVAQVVANLGANVATARAVIRSIAEQPVSADRDDCGCAHSLVGAVQTDPAAIDPGRIQDLDLLVGGDFQADARGVRPR